MATIAQHVLIVGGGLAGPALAVSLARSGIRSTIFEIRPVKGDSGGSITLAPNALRALDRSCGVYDAIKAAGYVYEKLDAYLDDGYKLGDMILRDDEYPAVRIMRTAIHQVLLDACEAKGVKIVWGAKLARVEEGDGVTAHFEDGSSATGDILIGADGIHSKVRQHVLGSAAPTPIYSGSCTVNGFSPKSEVIVPPGWTLPATIFTPVGIIMTVPVDPQGEMLAWGSSQALPEKDREGWAEYERSGEAARAAKKDYEGISTEPIKSLIHAADDTACRVWAPYSIPELPTWHTNRVLLVGDAAHALPPNGQGSAMAFEDAAYLARLLQSGSDYPKLFEQFEKGRRPRIATVAAVSKTAGSLKSANPSPWRWYLKKWLFWGFFWWNGWSIKSTKIVSYNIMDEPL